MAYTFLQIKNNAYSTLASGVSTGATSLVVANSALFPLTGNFRCTIWNKVYYPDCSLDPNMEIITVTNVSGTTFTVVKAQEGTGDNNHSLGDNIELLVTAGVLSELETRINLPLATTTITGNYAALLTDYMILANASAGPITITLPSAATTPGQTYEVKKIDSTSNTVTINTTSSQTIDGQLTQTIGYQNTEVNFTSDGLQWWMS